MITINDNFYRITKVANPNTKSGKLQVEIDFGEQKDYEGYDVFPDDKISDLIVAVGLHFKRKKDWGKITRKFEKGVV
jgi:hypothetical protein